MNHEIINDFFQFLSTDKKIISNNDIDKLESLLNKNEFEDMNEPMSQFINDLIYNYLDCNLNIIDEVQINKSVKKFTYII